MSPTYYNRAAEPMSLTEWAESLGSADRKVAGTDIKGSRVSTVWLGLNHNFSDEGPPLIFETMVFDGEHDQWCARYSTEDDAREGHEAVVRWLRGEGPEPGGE
jgi:hypothetical protein